MNAKALLSLLLIVALVGHTLSQRQGGRRRSRIRPRKRDQCHLREVENCINKMQRLGKGPDPTSLIATSQGINRICKSVREDLIKCTKSFFKKCGTPLHREVLDLYLDQVTSRMDRFCADDSPRKQSFLTHSPCLHTNVFKTDDYKTQCNNEFLRVVDKIDQSSVANKSDDLHSLICCGYNTWRECTSKLAEEKCGAESVTAYRQFVGATFGSVANMACPTDLFPSTSDLCVRLKPPADEKPSGKVGDNALTKYVTSMFSFLFHTEV